MSACIWIIKPYGTQIYRPCGRPAAGRSIIDGSELCRWHLSHEFERDADPSRDPTRASAK